MKQNVDKILEDLYAIDNSLRTHEKEMRSIIEALLQSKPDTKFDKVFAEELRARFAHKELGNILSLHSAIFSQFNVKYIAVGLVAIVGIVVFASIYPISRGGDISQEILGLKSNAFGQFAYSQGEEGVIESSQGLVESRVSSAVPSPSIGGGGVQEPAVSIFPVPPPREFTTYKYVYRGGDFEIPQDNNLVFKRIKGIDASSGLTSILSRLNVDLVDIGTFQNLNLQNISFKEKGDEGYSISVNFEDGSVSMYFQSRGPINTFDSFAPVEIPSDGELIAIAEKFMVEHKVDTSSYGDPKVLFRPEVVTLSPSSSRLPYYFDSISLQYPLLIDGKPALDSGGGSSGMEVSISIQRKQVSGLYNLTTQKYESSVYDLVLDKEKILGLAEAGGREVPIFESKGKVTEIFLGTPEPALMRFMRFDSGTFEDFYIPALSFPITDAPDELGFWRKNIVVPLVEGFVNEHGPVILERIIGEVEVGIEMVSPPAIE